MTSYNNNELSAPGMMASKHTGSDWAFQGNTVFEPVYDGDFEADIDAIAESVGGDSGYFSNETDPFETRNDDVTYYDDLSSSSNVEVKTATTHSTTFYVDVAASDKSNHGSIYDGTLNKSTTHAEQGTAYGKLAKETRMSKTLYHHVPEYEHKTPHKYSFIESSGPRRLEDWAKTHHRHECNAYRLEQPSKAQSSKAQSSKRRKTGSKK